jgi:hypothetical protein
MWRSSASRRPKVAANLKRLGSLPLFLQSRDAHQRSDAEAIMNILLWYLPYAMFSGGCDVVPAESGTASERRADCAGREQETDDEAGRNDDEIQSRRGPRRK